MTKKILLISFCLLLAGCAGAERTPDPVGIGTGTNELKRSPCACILVPMTFPGSTMQG